MGHVRPVDTRTTLCRSRVTSVACSQSAYKVSLHLASVPAAGQTFATTLNFTPMDGVMTSLVTQFKHEGETIARLFPPEQNVLSKWAEQVLDELVSTSH